MLLLALVGLASAQEIPKLNAQLYRHSIDARATLWADDTSLPQQGSVHLRLGTVYARNPLVYRWSDGEVDALLSDVVQTDLMAATTVGPVRVGLDVPLVLWAATLDGGGAGLGDLAADAKARVLDRDDAPLGLAFGLRVGLPTTTVDAPVGSRGASYQLQVIADREVGPVLLAANLGTRGVPGVELENITWNDQFFYRLGGGLPVTDRAGVSLDLAGHLNYSEALRNTAGSPVEVLLGGWGRPVDGPLVIRGGLGRGLTQGIGSPSFRAVLAVGYEPDGPRDRDGDGLADADDTCPDDAEDLDGFEDSDGCPDLDNDGDGLVDVQDRCPNEPEDVDGHDDADGCPEDPIPVALRVTNRAGQPIPDGVVVLDGPTPGEGGSTWDAALNPGTYTVQISAEGFAPQEVTLEVPDDPAGVEQAWVLEPVVLLGTVAVRVRDPEGTLLDARWSFDDQPAQPVLAGEAEMDLSPGLHDLTVRADGYVPIVFPVVVEGDKRVTLPVTLNPSKVQISAERIDIADKVYFQVGSAEIKPESFELLSEVATLILDHPEITLLRVEGHTDSRGDDAYNLQLSQDRADAVRLFFIDAGLAPDRIVAEGFGETQPLDAREVPEAWDRNRRVEFFIAERDDD